MKVPDNQDSESNPPIQDKRPAGGRSPKRSGKAADVDRPPPSSGVNRNLIGIAIGAVAVIATVVVLVLSNRGGGRPEPAVRAGFLRFHSASSAYRIDYPKTWTRHARGGSEVFVGYGPSTQTGVSGPLRTVIVYNQPVGSQTTTDSYATSGQNTLEADLVHGLARAVGHAGSIPTVELQYVVPDFKHKIRVAVFVVKSRGWRIALTTTRADFQGALQVYGAMLRSFALTG